MKALALVDTEAEAEAEAGLGQKIVYIPSALAQCAMPQTQVKGSEFIRRNGSVSIHLLAPGEIGLPYGGLARLLVAYLTAEALRRADREIILPEKMSNFLRALGKGNSTSDARLRARIHDQARRLGSSIITVIDQRAGRWTCEKINIIEKLVMPGASLGRGEACVVLSENFAQGIWEGAVPVDLKTLVTLSHSALAMDLYTWITWRVSYLGQPIILTWSDLHAQYGGSGELLKHFKQRFFGAARAVAHVYPQANITLRPAGLLIKPSATHVVRRAQD